MVPRVNERAKESRRKKRRPWKARVHLYKQAPLKSKYFVVMQEFTTLMGALLKVQRTVAIRVYRIVNFDFFVFFFIFFLRVRSFHRAKNNNGRRRKGAAVKRGRVSTRIISKNLVNGDLQFREIVRCSEISCLKVLGIFDNATCSLNAVLFFWIRSFSSQCDCQEMDIIVLIFLSLGKYEYLLKEIC